MTFEGTNLTNPAPSGDDGVPVAGFPYRFPNQRVTDQCLSIKVPVQ